MNYLLDTHAVLWIVAEDSLRLSPKIRALTRSKEADEFGLAAITLLEIARLAKVGAISPTKPVPDWIDDMAHRFHVLPLTPAIAWRSVDFDWSHKDPADRIICATALEHQLTLITHDKEITRWGGVPVLW